MFTHTLINIITGEASIFACTFILQFVIATPVMIVSCDHIHMTQSISDFFLNNAESFFSLISSLWKMGDQKRHFIDVFAKWFSCYPIKGIANLFSDDESTNALYKKFSL